MSLPVLLLVALACLARLGSAQPVYTPAELKKVQAALEELQADRKGKQQAGDVAYCQTE